MRNYNRFLKGGQVAQLEKLKMNEHKSDLENQDLFYVFRRMEEELEELRQELFDDNGNRKPYLTIDFLRARHEFADNSNFAYMGISTCNNELKWIVK